VGTSGAGRPGGGGQAAGGGPTGAGRRRRRDLRRELLSAAEAVFASSGYAASSVDDVIRAAGTSRASFYRYFASKDALFEELSRECFQEMREVVGGLAAVRSGARPPGGPGVPATAGEALEKLLGRYRELHERRRGVIRAWEERSGPAGSPTRQAGREALAALVVEAAGAFAGSPAERGPDVRPAVLFTAIERSAAYLTSRSSRLAAGRLDHTLAAMISRAYFGG